MPAHDEILTAARNLCRRRGNWRFRPVEIVRALPHLVPGTVRTHIVSRCCVNAPQNHPHRWDYFRRVSRGVYEIRKPFRVATPAERKRRAGRAVAEARATYGPGAGGPLHDTVHAVVGESRGWYVGECLELAVVTQARTLDELVANLRDAVTLHLEGENSTALGLTGAPRLAVSVELPLHGR